MTSLKKMWAAEPVVLSTVLGLAVTAGAITADQASAVSTQAGAVITAVAALVQIGLQLKVRASVTSPKTASIGEPMPDLMVAADIDLGPVAV